MCFWGGQKGCVWSFDFDFLDCEEIEGYTYNLMLKEIFLSEKSGCRRTVICII